MDGLGIAIIQGANVTEDRLGSTVSYEADPDLTVLARAQARAVGERVVDVGFDDILQSPRRRAVETASIMAAVTGVAPRRACTQSVHADDRTPIPHDLSMRSEQLSAFLGACLQKKAMTAALRSTAPSRTRPRRRGRPADSRSDTILSSPGSRPTQWGARPMRWVDLGTDNGALKIVRDQADAATDRFQRHLAPDDVVARTHPGAGS